MLDSCMNWTTATSIRTRGLREHPESTDLSRSCREASDLPGKNSSRESVRLFSCPSTPLNPFFSANAHCLRADRRDARVHCRKQKCAYSAQFWCNVSPFRINTCKSVSKQRTSTSFRMNTYEKTPGGWGPHPYLLFYHHCHRLCPARRRRPFRRKLNHAVSGQNPAYL